jgi:hypothetical protein
VPGVSINGKEAMVFLISSIYFKGFFESIRNKPPFLLIEPLNEIFVSFSVILEKSKVL